MPRFKFKRQQFKNSIAPRIRRLHFRTIKGTKGEGDEILQVNTHGSWINITFPDILYILNHLFTNEDRIYPVDEGYRGRWYLYDIITLLAKGASVKELLVMYGDKKHESRS